MKWSIAGLFSLGFIAAISAVVLVISLQSRAGAAPASAPGAAAAPQQRMVPVLVAAHDLELRAEIDETSVLVKEVPAESAPEGALGDRVQAVGKVLVRPLKEGQALLAQHFADESSALYMASAVKPGMRAVSVALSDAMRLQGLLHPGSVVDVISSIKVDGQDGLGAQPVSRTLLEGVLVLAVGDRTITSPGEGDEDSRSSGVRPVTLLVTPEQAELLSLATEQGSISLTLRNPNDEGLAATDGAELTELSPLVAESRRRARERQEQLAEQQRLAAERDRLERELELARAAKQPTAGPLERPPLDGWQTLVVRGGVGETKHFPDAGTSKDRSDPDQR